MPRAAGVAKQDGVRTVRRGDRTVGLRGAVARRGAIIESGRTLRVTALSRFFEVTVRDRCAAAQPEAESASLSVAGAR